MRIDSTCIGIVANRCIARDCAVGDGDLPAAREAASSNFRSATGGIAGNRTVGDSPEAPATGLNRPANGSVVVSERAAHHFDMTVEVDGDSAPPAVTANRVIG